MDAARRARAHGLDSVGHAILGLPGDGREGARRTAELLSAMMRTTITQGTSRKAFHDARGKPLLGQLEVAGKTGTLSRERPYRGYSWWVGFAPLDRPAIAVSVLLRGRRPVRPLFAAFADA